MARSQNSYIKKKKAEEKRKKKAEKFQKRLDKKNQPTSGSLDDMIAYVDEFGNPTSTPPGEESAEETSSENAESSLTNQNNTDENRNS